MRFLTFGAIGALAAVAFVLGSHLRGELQNQILSRDVALLEAVAALEYERLNEELFGLPIDFRAMAVSASALRGVLAMVIYDREGWMEDVVPDETLASPLSANQLAQLQAEGGLGQFHPRMSLDEVFEPEGSGTSHRVPLLEITVPVRDQSGAIQAFASYWLDGTEVAREFAELDRQLWIQGIVAWLAGSCLTVILGFWGARRLRQTADQLAERSQSLERSNRQLGMANADLELAARSSAIGAISAHLIHGLKNPLAGLAAYLRAHGNEDAREAARRMENLVRDTLAALRTDARPGKTGDLNPHELGTVLQSRLQAVAESANVRLDFRIPTLEEVAFSIREANLILLVLENLLVNAIEASPRGETVTLALHVNPAKIRFEVIDRGTGIPEDVGAQLFQVGGSTKSNGSGLGLAISRQLARAAGGELLLASTGPSGSCFVLEIKPTRDPDNILLRADENP